jgi:amidase
LLASIASAYPAPRFEEARRNAEETLSHSDIPLLARARAEGVVLSLRHWIATDTARTVERDDWRRLFKEFDVVITPASPTTAFPHDQTPDQWGRHINIDGSEYAYADQLVWAGVASAAGLPSTAVPIAASPEGLPIGVQLIGPMYEDRTPIRLAGWLEQTYRGFVAPTFN